MTICKLCGNKFKDYQGRGRTRCGSCNTKIRRYRTKAAAIKLLGGKCMDCGWKGNQAAIAISSYRFSKKDFTIGNVANKNWDVVKKEFKKCVLICANCHTIRHSTKDSNKFITEAIKYRGRKLDI